MCLSGGVTVFDKEDRRRSLSAEIRLAEVQQLDNKDLLGVVDSRLLLECLDFSATCLPDGPGVVDAVDAVDALLFIPPGDLNVKSTLYMVHKTHTEFLGMGRRFVKALERPECSLHLRVLIQKVWGNKGKSELRK